MRKVKGVLMLVFVYFLVVLNFLAIGSMIPPIADARWTSPVGIVVLFLVPGVVAILVTGLGKVLGRVE